MCHSFYDSALKNNITTSLIQLSLLFQFLCLKTFFVLCDISLFCYWIDFLWSFCSYPIRVICSYFEMFCERLDKIHHLFTILFFNKWVIKIDISYVILSNSVKLHLSIIVCALKIDFISQKISFVKYKVWMIKSLKIMLFPT